MKSIILMAVISLVIIFCPNLHAQTDQYNQVVKDAGGNDMLLGKCTISSLRTAPFDSWFFSSWHSYTVDSATCNFIRPLLKGKKLLLFLGTWCGDSRREVPRMLKMLECCNFPEQDMQLVMVSNGDSLYKQSPTHEERGYGIVRVPTLVILTNGIETGRIVEFPVISLEKDLLAILRKDPYTPNYSGQKVSR
jgi:hypothetical protein